MRRLIFILVIVLVIGGGIAGYYFLRPYINPRAPVVETPDVTTTTTTDPSFDTAPFGESPEVGGEVASPANSAVGSLSLLYNSELFDYWLDPSDRSVFLVVQNGKIIKAGVGGERETLFSFNPNTYKSVVPSADGMQFILLDVDAGAPRATLVSATTGEQTSLISGVTSAAWSPDQKEIALLVEPTPSRAGGLHIFNVNSGARRLALPLQMLDGEIFWPATDEIYIMERPSHENLSSLFVFSPARGSLKEVIGPTTGLMGEWSSNWGVFSGSGETNLRGLTEDKGIITLPLWTLASKCTIAPGATICGVPYNSFKRSQMPDSYLQRDIFTLDSIVAFGPDGSLESLLGGTGTEWSLDVYKPKKVGDTLYFINRYDNSLYGLIVDL